MERSLLDQEDLADVVDFIAACHAVGTPRPQDLCKILSRVRNLDGRAMTLGLCRMGPTRAEHIELLRFARSPESTCTCGSGSVCRKDEPCSSVTAPLRAQSGKGMQCCPDRYARAVPAEDGVVFCQSDEMGRGHAFCLHLEGSDTLPQSTKTILELVVPHFLHLVPGLLCSTHLMPQLTAREKEVLKWVGEGKSNWEISRILGISERTAKFHVSNLFSKLDISNRAQAAAIASIGF